MMLNAIVVISMAAILTGCTAKGQLARLGPKKTRTAPAQGIWRATAASMRIYPGSRFIADNKHISLEVRIELLDEMQDSIKGAGRFHLQLTNKQSKGLTAAQMRLYAWDVPLLTLAQQQRFYDRVTRTYLFRLKMDEQLLPPQDTVLKVTFTQAGGNSLTAQTQIKGK